MYNTNLLKNLKVLQVPGVNSQWSGRSKIFFFYLKSSPFFHIIKLRDTETVLGDEERGERGVMTKKVVKQQKRHERRCHINQSGAVLFSVSNPRQD